MRNFNARLTPLRVCVHGLILGVVLSVGNAQGTDNPMPPQVKRLIGMKIPAKGPGQAGVIQGWNSLGAGMLEPRLENSDQLGYDLLYQGNITILLISSLDAAHNMQLIDARELPGQLLEYGNINGKAVFKKNANQVYSFQIQCSLASRENPMGEERERIVGLVRPERGEETCQHWTKRVKRAWSVDLRSGHISDISPAGISCLYQAEDYCP